MCQGGDHSKKVFFEVEEPSTGNLWIFHCIACVQNNSTKLMGLPCLWDLRLSIWRNQRVKFDGVAACSVSWHQVGACAVLFSTLSFFIPIYSCLFFSAPLILVFCVLLFSCHLCSFPAVLGTLL